MILEPPLLIDYALASVLCPEKNGTKKKKMGPRPTRAHLISWAAEREGYYSHSWNVQGMSVTVETCQMLLHYGKGHVLYQRLWITK